jgi:serine/threonine protein kinase
MLARSTGSVFADVERLGARDRQGEVRIAKAHVMARLFGTDARQRLGRYELEVCIGEGAHGRVYRAFDPRLRRHVAIKVLRAEPGLLPSQLRRARAEAHGLARLQHPGVVAAYDVGTAEVAPGEAVLYLVMELVDGLDLGHWLAARRRPWQDVLRVGLSAGRGLAAAHRAGLVHRDVKPGNVLVQRGGTAKVADFGLVAHAGSPSTTARTQGSLEIDARATATGHVLGTPLYMPPEQHDGGTVDARADQYAFCVALW